MAEIGKKGVMAKREEIQKTARGIEEAAKRIETGVSELQSAIQAQAKENEEAVANIGKGTQQVLSGAKKLGDEFKRYREENFSVGIRDFWYG